MINYIVLIFHKCLKSIGTNFLIVLFSYKKSPYYCNQKQPPEVFYKKGVLWNFTKFTGKHLYQNLFFKSLAQMFSCEFWEISKKTFFYRTPLVVASGIISKISNRDSSTALMTLLWCHYCRSLLCCGYYYVAVHNILKLFKVNFSKKACCSPMRLIFHK